MGNFGIDDYDENGNLRMGLILPLLVIVYSRFLLYGPISLIGGRAGNPMGKSSALDLSFLTNFSPFLVLSSILPVIILYLLLYREKRGTYPFSWLWDNGRAILIISALSQFVFVHYKIIGNTPLNMQAATTILMHILGLFVLAKSDRVKNIFTIKN